MSSLMVTKIYSSMNNQQQIADITSRISDIATYAHVCLVDYGGPNWRTQFYDPKLGMQKIAELHVLFHELRTALHSIPPPSWQEK